MGPKQIASCILLLSLVTGCGGEGANSSKTQFQGSVIDGYIQNASVCLDVNGNLACDPEEPQAVTDASGSYSFEYSGDTTGLHIIAVVDAGSVDLDLGPVTEPFTLLAPASAPKAITPLTSLVSSEMIDQGVSADDAQVTIRATLGLDRDLLDYDFKKAGDTNTGQVAQLAAMVLANAMSAISSDPAAASEMNSAKILKAAINEAKNILLPALLSRDGRPLVDLSNVRSHLELSNAVKQVVDVKATVSGRINSIVARSKSETGGILDMKATFANGFVIAVRGGSSIREEDGSGGPKGDNLSVQYVRAAEEGELDHQRSVLFGDIGSGYPMKWYEEYFIADTPHYFDGEVWKDGIADKNFIQYAGNCILVTRQLGDAVGWKYCGTELDLAGMRLAQIRPDFCKDEYKNRSDPGTCNPNAVFPSGAAGIELTITANQDNYQLYKNDIGYGVNLDAMLTGGEVLGGSGVCMKIDTSSLKYNGNQISGGAISFGEDTGDCEKLQSKDFVETGTFTVDLVGGKRVMKFATPNLVRKVRPIEVLPYLIFAEAETQGGSKAVFKGDLMTKGYRISLPFTTFVSRSPQVGSIATLNAYMKELGYPLYQAK